MIHSIVTRSHRTAQASSAEGKPFSQQLSKLGDISRIQQLFNGVSRRLVVVELEPSIRRCDNFTVRHLLGSQSCIANNGYSSKKATLQGIPAGPQLREWPSENERHRSITVSKRDVVKQ
jgi:hypothetical protein